MKRIAAIAATVTTALALSIAPASAHASLQSSNPAENAVLDAAPDEVTLTFSQNVQSTFATVTVVGSDQSQWAASEPVVDGATVTVDLDGLGAAGEYTIGYRVVSADGHPITGSIPFQLTQSSPAATTPPATNLDVTNKASQANQAEPQKTEDNSGFPLWIIALVVVAVGASGVLFALRKRTR